MKSARHRVARSHLDRDRLERKYAELIDSEDGASKHPQDTPVANQQDGNKLATAIASKLLLNLVMKSVRH